MEMRESRQASPEQLKSHCLSAELGLCASGVGDGGFYKIGRESFGDGRVYLQVTSSVCKLLIPAGLLCGSPDLKSVDH